MEIDATGPGIFVGDFIAVDFPNVKRITYSPENKSRMVQKALSVISQKRFEYDENDKTLPLAFMTIYQKTTDKGVITYASNRTKLTGHSDEAWATMHAMMCEDFNPDSRRNFSFETFH
jgi:hypothetical protein